ncbi:metal ABC transporter ATP-binding protein [Clostridium sp.]|uniref:metal ABC transporter ATP-binding protein n=1 Tax=Clostridium sp. TaxID=1506 RepID=UPI0026357D33|nr:metal ABC transporter ATP-binding protein [Clostridium sp.]
MININNLCFSYSGSKPYQLNNINLSLPENEFISIIGENGSSKTTLLKLLLGYLKPIEGNIEINLNSVGYVPQKVDNFNSQFSITVLEVLKIHLKTLKIKDKTEIDRVLKAVNMLEFKNNLIGSLSGGQQQRIFIARALIGHPNILILDEPSTGIDEKTQKDIYDLIYKLNKKKDMTIICVEHNIEKSIRYSSYILELKNSSATLFKTEDFVEKLDKIKLNRKGN